MQHKLPIMTDEQKLALEYIRQHPNQTSEEILNYFCGWGQGWEYIRGVYSGAIEFLILNDYAIRDPKNQGIKIRE